MATGMGLFAQSGYVKLKDPRANVSVKASILDQNEPAVTLTDFTPETAIVNAETTRNANGLVETHVMTTQYDLQTNSCLSNRLVTWPDGAAAAVETWGNVPTAFADRGTGYNFYNGSAWGTLPTARIEDVRSGWGSIAPMGENGEVLMSHTGTAIQLFKRDTRGTGAWTKAPAIPNPGTGISLTWPRVATTGANHEVIHSVAAYQDAANTAHNEVFYSRSEDFGETFQDFAFVPEVDHDFYNFNISADDYTIATNGDNIAILFASAWYDLFYVKSADGGLTWEKNVIWEHPYPTFDFNVTLTTDTLWTCDNTANIAIDNSGMVHVVWATSRVMHDVVGTTYNYFPITDGICYWNESMGQIPENPENVHKTLDPTYLDGLGLGIVVGWVPDIDGGGVNLADYEIMAYRSLGLSTLPAISVDENGSIAIVFSTQDETRHNDVNYYRSVYTTYKDGIYGSWYYDYENLMSNIIHIFDEGFYTTSAPLGLNGNFYVMYNADAQPGTALDADQEYIDNKIFVVKISPVIIGVNENVNPVNDISAAYPNPATETINFDLNLSQPTANVNITLSTITGQVVYQEVVASMQTGMNKYSVDASNLKSGVYFCNISVNGYNQTKKVVVE